MLYPSNYTLNMAQHLFHGYRENRSSVKKSEAFCVCDGKESSVARSHCNAAFERTWGCL